MKSWLWKEMLAAAIVLPALSGVARADDFGCSDATLKVNTRSALPRTLHQVFRMVHQVLGPASRFSTARAISRSVITRATAFERGARPISHRKGKKPAPTRSIATARAAW